MQRVLIPGRRDRLAWIAALCAALLVAACGGGGDPPPTPEPVEVVGPGELKSAAVVGTVAAADIAAALASGQSKAPPLTPRYSVRAYRLNYLTTDGQGQPILASGLAALPLKPAGSSSPVLSYQHGTIFHDDEAPSNALAPGEAPLVLASLGYLVVAADYVGYGASKGAPHPYLASTPTAAAVRDLLTAVRTWQRREAIADNGQLFLAGYSEGGYATMAAHRAMQAASDPELARLVASGPGAGPYHVGATLDALLDRVRDENPLLAALVSPGLLRHLGSTVRDELRRALVRALMPDDADVVFDTAFIDRYLADDDGAIELHHNVHDWRPEAPVAMFHGRDDQTVPYVASERTLQAMRARGATAATLTDCAAVPSSHLGCVAPWVSYLLERLSTVVRDL